MQITVQVLVIKQCLFHVAIFHEQPSTPLWMSLLYHYTQCVCIRWLIINYSNTKLMGTFLLWIPIPRNCVILDVLIFLLFFTHYRLQQTLKPVKMLAMPSCMKQF